MVSLSVLPYNYKDLKCGLPLTLDEILPIAFVRRAFNHCLRFMAGYRVGLTGAVLEYSVKKYKSRRRLSACINLATLDLEYKTKKEEQMTFKLRILMSNSNLIFFVYFF